MEACGESQWNEALCWVVLSFGPLVWSSCEADDPWELIRNPGRGPFQMPGIGREGEYLFGRQGV